MITSTLPRLVLLSLWFGISGCGSTVLIQDCGVDMALIQPLQFPPKPAKPVNEDLINALVLLKTDITADNARKDELRHQLESCH